MLHKLSSHAHQHPPLPTLDEVFRAKVFEDERETQRLEFLGDAILYSTVAQIMFEFGEREGKMTKIRERLVSNQLLSMFSTYYDLAAHLKLSPNNEHVRSTEKTKADVFESYVAAVYLYRGSEVLRTWLRGLILPYALELNEYFTENANSLVQPAYGTFPKVMSVPREIERPNVRSVYSPLTICGLKIPFLFFHNGYEDVPGQVSSDSQYGGFGSSVEEPSRVDNNDTSSPCQDDVNNSPHNEVACQNPPKLSATALPFTPNSTSDTHKSETSSSAHPEINNEPAAIFAENPVAFLKQKYDHVPGLLKFNTTPQMNSNHGAERMCWVTDVILGNKRISTGSGNCKKESARVAAEKAAVILKLVEPDPSPPMLARLHVNDGQVPSSSSTGSAVKGPPMMSASIHPVPDPPGTFYRLSFSGSPSEQGRLKFFFWIMRGGACLGFGAGFNKTEAERKAREDMANSLRHKTISSEALKHITPKTDDYKFRPTLQRKGIRAPDAYQEIYRVFGTSPPDDVKRIVFLERPPDSLNGIWSVKIRWFNKCIGEAEHENRSRARIIASEKALDYFQTN